MSLWGFVCSVHLCKSVRKRTHLRVVGRFFSHRAHRVNRAFLRTFRAHRTPPAYRVHRGLSAIIITKKGHNEAYILFIGVSRWLLPFPSGEGKGEGPLSFCPLCVLFICVLCEKKYVILYLSLCHSVFKKASVSLRHSVILSSKKHLLSFSLCHYVGRQRIQNLDKTVQKKQKRGCVYYDTPSFVMLLPRRGNQFSASFLFLSSICDVFYSNVHISCNNLCITLEVFSVVPLQITFKSFYRRQS